MPFLVLVLYQRNYYNLTWKKLTDDGFKFITRQVSNAIVEEIGSTYMDNELVFDSEITLGTN
ncbi:hypothetical protein GOQ29_05385 [Clostridium sp. D2Q-14]|uniref:hypothetical protein n=1 Tax=Anaeromonas gelatinilytica TaxID=2683194 RepID=UPI00193C0B37|nr:hypothetical protein [Anaeromonas gelatinilytica]MBS4535051.1 hypothetical protein [Anaeromonas gelatinilytica]